ncbi:MAG: MazG nucleotide pyrophosphohydrolase domain-containing protein [Bacteroidota bacterium]|mgnify:CR=1 FL=1
MTLFPKNTSLSSLQAYQKAICKERGWDKATVLETFLLFSEEVGELAKAIRYRENIYTEKGKAMQEEALAFEFADVFSYLLELANQLEIDMEEAYRIKEKINAERSWN